MSNISVNLQFSTHCLVYTEVIGALNRNTTTTLKSLNMKELRQYLS